MTIRANASTSFSTDDYDRRIQEASRFLGITRCSSLQEQVIRDLEDLLAQTQRSKENAIAVQDVEHANLLLGCECFAGALASELQMWLLLKEGDPSSAWDKLVDAQTAVQAAPRAHSTFRQDAVALYHDRLEEIERVVFPPQTFLSAGLLVNRYECSVCGEDYDDCDHLMGEPYMGRFCVLIVRETAELDHVAIVDAPRDKRCRVTAFQDGSIRRDAMTMRVLQDEDEASGSSVEANRRPPVELEQPDSGP